MEKFLGGIKNSGREAWRSFSCGEEAFVFF
jgi:hypothetical protein